MRIAELFVALGINIDGAEKLDAVDKTLSNAAANAGAAIPPLLESSKAAGTAAQGMSGLAAGMAALGAKINAAVIGLKKTALGGQQAGKGVQQAGQAANQSTFHIAKITAAVTALSAAFLVLMNNALRTAVALKDFDRQTGASTDELQRWRHAAQINDVTGEELTETVKGLQKASADIALGQGNIAPWQLLGISPHQDPFLVLDQLRDKLKKMPPDIARTVAAEMGISDKVFQMLLSDLGKLDNAYLMTKEERQSLIDLNRAWQDLLFSINAMKNRIAAVLAEPLAALAKIVKFSIDIIATLYHWINRIPVVGWLMRQALVALALALGIFIGLVMLGITVMGGMALGAAALAAASAGLATALEVASVASGALSVALGILEAVGAPLLILIGLIVAGLASFIVVANDIYHFFKGDKSMFGEVMHKDLELLKKLVDAFVEAWRLIKLGAADTMDYLKSLLPEWAQKLFGGGDASLKANISSHEQSALTPTPSMMSSNVHQTNDIDVHVDGADRPAETGREVGLSIKRAISDASYQIPVPSY